MRLQALKHFCAAAVVVAPLAASAQPIPGLPPQVQAVHLENVRMCTEQGSKLNIQVGYVWRTDFNGDGKTDYVLDQHALECVGAYSIYGGSAGIWYNIFISNGGRYTQQDVIGDDGKLVRRGKRMLFSLAVKDGTTDYWGWNGKAFAPVK